MIYITLGSLALVCLIKFTFWERCSESSGTIWVVNKHQGGVSVPTANAGHKPDNMGDNQVDASPILPVHNRNTNSGSGIIFAVNKNQGGVTVPITNSGLKLDKMGDHQETSPSDKGQSPVTIVVGTAPSSEAPSDGGCIIQSTAPILPAQNINTNSGSGIVFVVNENEDGVTVRLTNSGHMPDNMVDHQVDLSPSPLHQGQPPETTVGEIAPSSVAPSTGGGSIQSKEPVLPAQNTNTNLGSGIIFAVNKNQGGVTVPITNSGLKLDNMGDHQGKLSPSSPDQGQSPVTIVVGTAPSSEAPSDGGCINQSTAPILPAQNINTNSGRGLIFVVNKNQGGVTVPIVSSTNKPVHKVDHQGSN